MEEGDHELHKQEFIEAALRLLQTLSIDQKHCLLFNFRLRAASENPEFTFHV